MLSSRNSPRSFPRNLLLKILGKILPNIRANRFWRERNSRNGTGMSVDEFLLSFVPRGKKLGGRRSAYEAGVRYTSKADPWNVARCGIDAFEVPDCLGCPAVEFAS